MTEQINYQT